LLVLRGRIATIVACMAAVACRPDAPTEPVEAPTVDEPPTQPRAPFVEPIGRPEPLDDAPLDFPARTETVAKLLQQADSSAVAVVVLRYQGLARLRHELEIQLGEAPPFAHGRTATLRWLAELAQLSTAPTLDLSGCDLYGDFVVSLLGAASGGSAVRVLLEQGLSPSFDGIRHQVSIPATDPALLAQNLAKWLEPIGRSWPEIVGEHDNAMAWIIERERQRKDVVAVLAEAGRVRVVLLEGLVRPDTDTDLDRWRARLEQSPSADPDSAALRLLGEPTSPVTMLVRPGALPAWQVSHTVGTIRSIVQEMKERSDLHRGIAMALAEVIVAREASAELDNIAVALTAIDGKVRLRMLAGLTPTGRARFGVGRSRETGRLPSSAHPHWAELTVELAPLGRGAGDVDVMPTSSDVPEVAVLAPCAWPCHLHAIARRPLLHLGHHLPFPHDDLAKLVHESEATSLRGYAQDLVDHTRWVVAAGLNRVPSENELKWGLPFGVDHKIVTVGGRKVLALLVGDGDPVTFLDTATLVDPRAELLHLRADAAKLVDAIEAAGLELPLADDAKPGQLRLAITLVDSSLAGELVLAPTADFGIDFVPRVPNLDPPLGMTAEMANAEACVADVARVLGNGLHHWRSDLNHADHRELAARELAYIDDAAACASDDDTAATVGYLREAFVQLTREPPKRIY
jgi:hypothetical protein